MANNISDPLGGVLRMIFTDGSEEMDIEKEIRKLIDKSNQKAKNIEMPESLLTWNFSDQKIEGIKERNEVWGEAIKAKGEELKRISLSDMAARKLSLKKVNDLDGIRATEYICKMDETFEKHKRNKERIRCEIEQMKKDILESRNNSVKANGR